ncbi:hypothetical protein KI387_042471, partial [Taxus chinensis]
EHSKKGTMDEHGQRPPPNDALSYMNETISRVQRELQQAMRENQREMRDAFTSSIRDLAMALQGNTTAPNHANTNAGEGSSMGANRNASNTSHTTFKAKFLHREEPIEEVVQSDVDDVEAYGDEYMQLSLR